MRIALAAAYLAFGTLVAVAQTQPADKSGKSPHSTGITVSPETKSQSQPQGPTGPLDTKSDGAPAASPQGQTPPGMQAAPGGSSKTVVDPDSSKNTVPPAAAGGDQQKPGSKIVDADPTDVFRNGILTVPGAVPDGQTAPAKFSARTEAADQLPIAAYALRHLSAQQRSRIHRALHKPMALSGDNFTAYAVVGAEIPTDAILTGLELLPDLIASEMPEMRGLAFLRAGDKVLLASPTMHRVLAVLE